MQASPPTLRVLLVGASGAVGSAVLAQALGHPRVAALTALTRRPIEGVGRLTNVVVDFDQLPEDAPWWQTDIVICTLGTTRRAAGSDEQFAAIDRDLVLRIARLARQAGATRFALNSSLGADAASTNFYLRVKGEAEEGLAGFDYPRVVIVRPSLIDTARQQRRPAEQLGIIAARCLRPLMPKRYRAVKPDAIAYALLEGALASKPGTHIIESDELMAPPVTQN